MWSTAMNVSSASVARTLCHCAHNPKWWIKFATWYQMQLCLGACLIISTAYFQKSVCPLMWKNMADATQGWRVRIKARTQVSLHLRLRDLCSPTLWNHYITYIFKSCVRHLVGHFLPNSCLCCTLLHECANPLVLFFSILIHSVCGWVCLSEVQKEN